MYKIQNYEITSDGVGQDAYTYNFYSISTFKYFASVDTYELLIFIMTQLVDVTNSHDTLI